MQKIFVETLGLRIVKNARIHYFHIDDNAPCLPPPKILHNRLFRVSPGYNSRPKGNPRKWLCKVSAGKQGALWCMRLCETGELQNLVQRD